ncbi:hypothetical protein SAMN05421747_12210 [Parapedobacter composti]|uniref:Uncharacterized protein n=1 Tax=Parapedobacter composti TaxID=623281 RepID=A0A1I1LJN7_9SPHI|nr:hypothetical protein SAMN05421747_12210 [Parapedobacter composti]
MVVFDKQFTRFQFLYGAIKGIGRQTASLDKLQFQFLYGAIKGSTSRMRSVHRMQFQFLYGAIKGIG